MATPGPEVVRSRGVPHPVRGGQARWVPNEVIRKLGNQLPGRASTDARREGDFLAVVMVDHAAGRHVEAHPGSDAITLIG